MLLKEELANVLIQVHGNSLTVCDICHVVEVEAAFAPLQQLGVLDVLDRVLGDAEVTCKELVGSLHKVVWKLWCMIPRETGELLAAGKYLVSRKKLQKKGWGGAVLFLQISYLFNIYLF